jgi:DNA-binding PadR family transcriptional regulator
MAKRRKVNNLTALGLLALLVPGQAMHPYQMATVLKRTGKERDLKIKWGTFYTVVQNLQKAGFIVATGSARAGGRPERTTYAITDEGRAELADWLREIVAIPEPELSRFEAALSVIGVLGPDETVGLLRQRHAALDADVNVMRSGLAAADWVPRIFLIEAEYALAMREAELNWVAALRDEIETGTLPGIDDWRRYFQTGEIPPGFAELLEESSLVPNSGQLADSGPLERRGGPAHGGQMDYDQTDDGGRTEKGGPKAPRSQQ